MASYPAWNPIFLVPQGRGLSRTPGCRDHCDISYVGTGVGSESDDY